jgi:peptidoglycan/xylan/chitin deacetylase (PgdA/CDA1 family)
VWKLPKDARVAIWVIPNVEHFLFDRPSTSLVAKTANLVPDVLNYSWRDYGVRVGIWRVMDILEKYAVRATAALNSDVCKNYPRIVEEGSRRGWEWMAHGQNNSTLMSSQAEEEERALISETLETIAMATGRRPRGWLSPALTESFATLDLLAEAGIEYVANWVNDEQPYAIRVRSGSMLSIPYTEEINDIAAFLELKCSGEEYFQMIVDQFDVLYEEGRYTGRVMAIALHPFIVGHPYRAKYLDKALAYITGRKSVWMATGSEIIDWYKNGKLT